MNQKLLQITGTPNLYRDMGSMAIVNRDESGLQEYQGNVSRNEQIFLHATAYSDY
jgi:hypothetical protein